MRSILSLSRTCRCVLALLLALASAAAVTANAAEWSFRVQFDESVHAGPFSGRVCLLLSRQEDPRRHFNWFHPGTIIARDVTDWQPGEILTFESGTPDGLITVPGPPADIDPDGLYLQAVVRFNRFARDVGTGPGNGYSQIVRVDAGSAVPTLVVDQTVPEPVFRETERVKLLRVRSKLLSEFHGRDVFLQGAVTLPAAYFDESGRKFPAIYEVPGFGGTHFDALRRPVDPPGGDPSVEFVHVMLDPSCPLGHHVFADSANNGPWGTALVTEFLSELERRFRVLAEPSARFLTGHSSGGWSSLWLQVSHPETFGGVWSTSPDPVDFRDFQQIDLYRAGEGMYVDARGGARPLARMRGRVLLWYRGFDEMERALGAGGQLHSFEAAFSPRGEDGRPLPAWDRDTGAVDTTVTKTWEKYDIRLVLERDWPTLGPKLAGKLHVFMGAEDTFYLEGATRLLKESLAGLGSDAVVEVVPGKDHFTLLSPDLRQRIRREMAEAFLESHAAGATK